MFLAKREGEARRGAAALTGPVTLPGDPAGAWIEGERRTLAVYAPGGYHWAPGLGDEVLVLKTGERGEMPCALGVPAKSGALQPGEVLITAGEAAIRLKPDGRVDVTGTLTVNGIPVALEGVAV